MRIAIEDSEDQSNEWVSIKNQEVPTGKLTKEALMKLIDGGGDGDGDDEEMRRM
ncbi:hypothetical protein TWF106_008463 [Orbilia oligospora]|uniref:Uncharacterized protein n=1 Tax=Orbilia oligospora TaxID=2813651 RepID=A0A6G1LW82_ORBOL|nr:hypothetical protein TWF788_002591 [Orbilia oligospora]KAF3215110.1 hypothetical protein TWF191_009403 [Orbilia oligospora]KAF3222523.1 hypothetical protein TWF679_005994 [Orbilia oligospora]KAF3228061.1 hypothetical protein TWF106_008463 [Orbilia oligospora]KAF3234318.1 hypothetical protein TWF192_001552 [Orbilia oligospora]